MSPMLCFLRCKGIQHRLENETLEDLSREKPSRERSAVGSRGGQDKPAKLGARRIRHRLLRRMHENPITHSHPDFWISPRKQIWNASDHRETPGGRNRVVGKRSWLSIYNDAKRAVRQGRRAAEGAEVRMVRRTWHGPAMRRPLGSNIIPSILPKCQAS